MADYIIAIDQGTTSSRAIIFDKKGSIIESGQKEHEQILPKAGWVEHDAAEIWRNVQEVIGTFVLVFVVLGFGRNGDAAGLASLGALPVALVVIAIGASLGGPTGYAINPARDLGPRIVHALLPIKGKGTSDWSYAWVPVAGPLVGGAIAGLASQVLLPVLT